MEGEPLKNCGLYVDSILQNLSEVFIWTNASVDTTKTVKPIKVAPINDNREGPNKKVEAAMADARSNYKTLTKYTYFESGEKYVKVLLDFPDAKSLLKKDQITCNFGDRSFEIFIDNYKGDNFKFAVPNLHHRILPKDCSFSFKSNNVQITLRKKKEDDNWWSLFKSKAVGERPGDSD